MKRLIGGVNNGVYLHLDWFREGKREIIEILTCLRHENNEDREWWAENWMIVEKSIFDQFLGLYPKKPKQWSQYKQRKMVPKKQILVYDVVMRSEVGTLENSRESKRVRISRRVGRRVWREGRGVRVCGGGLKLPSFI